jgi:hypothetical protein
VITPAELFESSVAWLRENYDDFGFEQERDLVWTVRTHLLAKIRKEDLPFTVFSGYRITQTVRESADLAILEESGVVEVAAEFKYEPAHARTDIDPKKLPVVFWGAAPSEEKGSVGHDVRRVKQFVESGGARIAYALFVDEGGHFRHRDPFPNSRWIDWGKRTPEGHSVSILWSRWPGE